MIEKTSQYNTIIKRGQNISYFFKGLMVLKISSDKFCIFKDKFVKFLQLFKFSFYFYSPGFWRSIPHGSTALCSLQEEIEQLQCELCSIWLTNVFQFNFQYVTSSEALFAVLCYFWSCSRLSPVPAPVSHKSLRINATQDLGIFVYFIGRRW